MLDSGFLHLRPVRSSCSGWPGADKAHRPANRAGDLRRYARLGTGRTAVVRRRAGPGGQAGLPGGDGRAGHPGGGQIEPGDHCAIRRAHLPIGCLLPAGAAPLRQTPSIWHPALPQPHLRHRLHAGVGKSTAASCWRKCTPRSGAKDARSHKSAARCSRCGFRAVCDQRLL